MTKRNHENTATRGDRISKQMIIGTLCFVVVMVTATMCGLAICKSAIPEPINTLATLIAGGLMGMLAKTGVDSMTAKSSEPMAVTVENDDSAPIPTAEKEDKAAYHAQLAADASRQPEN